MFVTAAVPDIFGPVAGCAEGLLVFSLGAPGYESHGGVDGFEDVGEGGTQGTSVGHSSSSGDHMVYTRGGTPGGEHHVSKNDSAPGCTFGASGVGERTRYGKVEAVAPSGMEG